jgi:hypothetical protein
MRRNHAMALSRYVTRWRSLVLALVVLAFASACSNGGPDELEITVQIDGDVMTIGWEDARPVHELQVNPTGVNPFTSLWYISVWEGRSIPNTPPAIVPPVVYGADVDGTFTLSGPDPLVKGTSYQIRISQSGWGESCNEQGIPVETATSQCGLGAGELLFTY